MLKQSILNQIREDKILIANIASLRSVEFQTVERWINSNHPSLMHILILKEIAKSLNVKTLEALYE